MSKLWFSALLLAAACSFGPGNIQSKHSTDLGQRKIKRIAILPPPEITVAEKKGPLGVAQPPESKSADREAELLARLVYSAMSPISTWQIVSESEVRDVGHGVQPGSEAARIKRIGEMVYADAVITGRIQRYRERVGEEWGAKSPASVAFVLDLVDVRRGDIIWSARFDETQKPLSENIFALGDITQRGVKWLSAEQLTAEGVRKAVSQLHQALFGKSI
jgi:TolB-like protein